MPLLKHGHCRPGLGNKNASREYTSYRAMIARCTKPQNIGYKHYGGRGITIFAPWLGDGGFERFLAYMGPRPLGMTLDRIMNDGNYEPGNVRWADKRTQALNVGPIEFARRQEMCRMNRRRQRRAMALNALARYGRLLGVRATDRLMSEIHEALVERFGPPANMSAPREMFCVEEAFIAGDFTRKSLYWDDLENLNREWRGLGTWAHLTRKAA